MADTNIEWTRGADGSRGKTWNPTRGCSRISPGCKNCYAERQALRQKNTGYKGLVHIVNGHPAWTGEVRMVEKRIADPLHWLDPKNIFVNSMSDLWHEKLSSGDQIDVYAVMAAANWHNYQVLTKRPELRLDSFSDSRFSEQVEDCAIDIIANWEGKANWVDWKFQWPLPNVWEGASVEDPLRKNRIDLLRQTPAAIRFLSIEPLLEDIGELDLTGIHWVIVGGESGPGARPFDIAWARRIKVQCDAQGIPFFFKQAGALPIMREDAWRFFTPTPLLSARNHGRCPEGYVPLQLGGKKGGDWDQWPTVMHDLRVREFPNTSILRSANGL